MIKFGNNNLTAFYIGANPGVSIKLGTDTVFESEVETKWPDGDDAYWPNGDIMYWPGNITPLPSPKNSPVISGIPLPGETLSGTTGTWTGADTFEYKWQNNSVDISGETTNSYDVVSGDAGKQIKMLVRATGLDGVSDWVESNVIIGVIANARYDAADTATITDVGGGNASQWNDKTGNGYHATQGTSAQRPKTGMRTLNGKNILDFDGTDDNFSIPIAALGSNQPAVTIIAIYLPDTTAGFIVCNGGSAVNQNRTRLLNQGHDFGAFTVSRPTKTTGTGIIQASRTGGPGIHASRMKVNNETQMNTGVFTRNSTATTLARIGRFGGSGSDFFNGGIAEIIIILDELSDAALTPLMQGLATKWNIAFDNATTRVVTMTTPAFVSAVQVPDVTGGDVGKGFTNTGLDIDLTDDTFWMGNFGAVNPADVTFVPELVHVSKTGGTLLAELNFTVQYPALRGIQGVTVDTSDNTLWFVSVAEDLIRHVQKDGTHIGSFPAPADLNGLAYDPSNDSLLVMCENGVINRYSATAGTLIATYNVGGHDLLDHLYLDVANNKFWYTFGLSNVDGSIGCYDPVANTIIVELTVPGTQCIEGIYIDSTHLYLNCDGYHHGGSPPLNRLLKFTFDKTEAY